MAEKKAGKAGIIASRTFNKREGSDKDFCDEIEVGVFETATATVSVPISLTHNLGNYESAKVGVVVTVPCYVEEIDDAFEYAREKAEEYSEKMSDFSAAYKRFLKGWRRGEFK